MNSEHSIPVIVLSGFLGAGKSTLLNALLARSDMADTGLIINEFGDIAIDHDLVTAGESEVIVTQGGCMCCTVGSDIRTALFDLYTASMKPKGRPLSRVIVETTGLADPAPIINQLVHDGGPVRGMVDQLTARKFHLGGFVCVVDSVAAPDTLNNHFECMKQIAFADRIVLTKTDLAGHDPAALCRTLGDINPAAEIIDRRSREFDIAAVFAPRPYSTVERGSDVAGWLAIEQLVENEPSRHAKTQAKRHDNAIQTFSLFHEADVDPGAFSAFMDILQLFAGKRLLRMKGLVRLATNPEQPLVIHAVQTMLHPTRHLDDWPSDDRRTRLVLIAHGLNEAVVKNLFTTLTSTTKATRRAMTAAIAAFVIVAAFAGLLTLTAHVSAMHDQAGQSAPSPHLGASPLNR